MPELLDIIKETVASAAGPTSKDFYEDTDNGANRIRVTAPSAVASDKTLTLPDITDTLVTRTATETLTNKRVDPRVVSEASNATPTPNADTTDEHIITAQAAAAAFAVPTGTPVQGQAMVIRIKDNGTARALSWNVIYRAIGVTLPATTVISKTLYIGMIYNATDTKWDVLGVNQEA
jgi:hypothetical protein